jgi:hypothetical protein
MDFKVKHLEMILSLISRVSSNSFFLKGWSLTLIAGVFALSAKDANDYLYLFSFVPILLFWFLDSYYLQLERKYRCLFNSVLLKKPEEIDFRLDITSSNATEGTLFCQCLLSKTELWFYFPLALLVGLILIISFSAAV